MSNTAQLSPRYNPSNKKSNHRTCWRAEGYHCFYHIRMFFNRTFRQKQSKTNACIDGGCFCHGNGLTYTTMSSMHQVYYAYRYMQNIHCTPHITTNRMLVLSRSCMHTLWICNAPLPHYVTIERMRRDWSRIYTIYTRIIRYTWIQVRRVLLYMLHLCEWNNCAMPFFYPLYSLFIFCCPSIVCMAYSISSNTVWRCKCNFRPCQPCCCASSNFATGYRKPYTILIKNWRSRALNKYSC